VPPPGAHSGERLRTVPATPRRIRVLCNADWFHTVADRSVEPRRLSGHGVLATLRAFWRGRDCDAVVFDNAVRQLLLFCLLRRLLPIGRWKLVSVDPLFSRPHGFRARLRARARRWLLGAADLFILYFRDTAELARLYGITADRVRYVPFKVNQYPQAVAAAVRDEGFILTCGRSHRDYATFCKAMEGLPYKACIVATLDALPEHGTTADFRALCPPNVAVADHDGSDDSWLDWIAGSTFVVLPISTDALTCAGISACLLAMALGKCVIITESPATRGVLEDGQVITVPSADVDALRAAIVAASEDASYRARIAAAGQRYARALGDHDRLAQDIVREVVSLVSRQRLERQGLDVAAPMG